MTSMIMAVDKGVSGYSSVVVNGIISGVLLGG